MVMKIILILLCVCALVLMMQLSVEKVELEYYNPKYFSVLNLTMKKNKQNAPYIINLYAMCLTGVGNNLTIKWAMYEMIGGHNVLTPIRLEYAFCDFLRQDTVIGMMISQQFPKNWTCPIPAGPFRVKDIIYRSDQFPYIPFTYSSLYVRIYTVIEAFFNKNSRALRWNFYFTAKQRLPGKNKN